MKKIYLLFIPALLVFASCSTGEAKKVADEFHAKYDNNEIDYIADNLLDTECTEEEVEGFREYLTSIRAEGKPENRSKDSGFSKKINGDVSTVRLNYTCEVEGETIYEGLVLIDRGDGEGYKLHVVSMHPDKSVVDSFMEGY